MNTINGSEEFFNRPTVPNFSSLISGSANPRQRVLHKTMGPERFSFRRAFATPRMTRLLADDVAGGGSLYAQLKESFRVKRVLARQ